MLYRKLGSAKGLPVLENDRVLGAPRHGGIAMHRMAKILLINVGVAFTLVLVLSTATGRTAAQSSSCGSSSTPEVQCNNGPDGSQSGHHSGGGCSYNAACTCWCSNETCASKPCGNGSFQFCGVQEACESYANGTFSHCLNQSGC